MLRLLIFAMMLTPFSAYAETYLCVPEAGALVEDGGKKGISALLANVTKTKYVLTNESGKWVVKQLGTDYAMFDKCEDYLCQRSEGYAGAFWLNKESGVFAITWIALDGPLNQLVVAKGRCSKL